jgi:hypothetical protein
MTRPPMARHSGWFRFLFQTHLTRAPTVGFGRVVTLHDCSSTLCQIYSETRCLFSATTVRPHAPHPNRRSGRTARSYAASRVIYDAFGVSRSILPANIAVAFPTMILLCC